MIDTALEFWWVEVASEGLPMKDKPASLNGEEIGCSDNNLGEATDNANDLH
jgi:hypothetical protein